MNVYIPANIYYIPILCGLFSFILSNLLMIFQGDIKSPELELGYCSFMLTLPGSKHNGIGTLFVQYFGVTHGAFSLNVLYYMCLKTLITNEVL